MVFIRSALRKPDARCLIREIRLLMLSARRISPLVVYGTEYAPEMHPDHPGDLLDRVQPTSTRLAVQQLYRYADVLPCLPSLHRRHHELFQLLGSGCLQCHPG